MPAEELDRVDRKILAELQRDGRLSNQELADRVSLSPSPCLRRVRRLEEQGYIKGYVALVDPGRVGLGLLAYITIRLNKHIGGSHAPMGDFAQAVQAWPEPLSTPTFVVDLDAFDANAADLVRRAGGTPIRVASKSLRVPALVSRALATPSGSVPPGPSGWPTLGRR